MTTLVAHPDYRPEPVMGRRSAMRCGLCHYTIGRCRCSRAPHRALTAMRAYRHDPYCTVPVPHRHRPPTPYEVDEARHMVTVTHPSRCAWRQDIYSGCSCGVTGLVMQLEDAMRE